MENQKLFIPILLGTVREGRQSELVAKALCEFFSRDSRIETQLLDPRTMNLPMTDEGEDLKFQNPEYRNAIMRADGLIIVTPEYNHGYPGSLKRALDILLSEYIHKAVGLVGVSRHGFGGIRAIEKLVSVVRELGLVVTFADLYYPNVEEYFDEQGRPKDIETFERRAKGFLDELVWMATVLKWGRENVPSKFDERTQQLEDEWKSKTS